VLLLLVGAPLAAQSPAAVTASASPLSIETRQRILHHAIQINAALTFSLLAGIGLYCVGLGLGDPASRSMLFLGLLWTGVIYGTMMNGAAELTPYARLLALVLCGAILALGWRAGRRHAGPLRRRRV